jgi:hypothetical protein
LITLTRDPGRAATRRTRGCLVARLSFNVSATVDTIAKLCFIQHCEVSCGWFGGPKISISWWGQLRRRGCRGLPSALPAKPDIPGTFAHEGVRLMKGRLREQYLAARNGFHDSPNDDPPRGFRRRAGLPPVVDRVTIRFPMRLRGYRLSASIRTRWRSFTAPWFRFRIRAIRENTRGFRAIHSLQLGGPRRKSRLSSASRNSPPKACSRLSGGLHAVLPGGRQGSLWNVLQRDGMTQPSRADASPFSAQST